MILSQHTGSMARAGGRKGENMEEMTKEEMQRFLNREAEKGTTEYEALKALADILGIAFPELMSKEEAAAQ